MAGLRVGTVGGGPTVQVARPGLGTGAVSLGGGDLSAQLKTQQAACLSKFHINSSKFRESFFSFCKRLASDAWKSAPFREDTVICKMRGAIHLDENFAESS